MIQFTSPYGIWRMIRAVTPDEAKEVERLGFGGLWVGGSPPGDLAAVEALLEATTTIPVGTAIVNVWKEEAATVASSYHRIAERHGERFLLGIGVGHPEVTGEYRRPYDKVVDYLDRLEEEGVPHERIILAALGPRMLAVAGERTAGAHPYLTTPAHTKFAREVLGDRPLVIPEHKVVLDSDPDRARAVGRPVVSRYLDRVNYRRNLLREGWKEADLRDGGSDQLVDALVLHGSAQEVGAKLAEHLAAGANHLGVQVLGDDPVSAYRQLAEVLL